MSRFPFILALGLFISAPPGLAALPAAAADTALPSLSPMIKKVAPAVVNISTQGTTRRQASQPGQPGEAGDPAQSGEPPPQDDPFFRRFFEPNLGPQQKFQSAGSGVIFDAKNGYIVTNAHVVENATEITVTLQDGQDLKARLVGADAPTDVAVLKVPSKGLVQLGMADSSRVEVGDFVVAIGNPYGLQHTVTSGIVSGLSRSGITANGFEDFIQTDASINPGNSGGALVNFKGELIGINSVILSKGSGGNIGIGFAIPMNMARAVIDQLVKFGAVKRGLLGVTLFNVTPDIAQLYGLSEARGALVSQVVEDSAAQKAGVLIGDVITSVSGSAVKSSAELRNVISQLRVGQTVEVGLIRDGRPRAVTATIAGDSGKPVAAAQKSVPKEADASIHSGLDGATLGDASDGGGALVSDVEPDSSAAQNGLRKDDVIVGVNRNKVATLAQLKEQAKGTATLILEVRREKTVLLVPLQAP